jgi:hypothetical protein
MSNRTPPRPKITRRRWTPEEDAIIRETYASTPAYDIAKRLDRTEDAVWQRAVRVLGLEKRQIPAPWSDAEVEELERRYSTEAPTAIARQLGRTPSSVYQQARYLGLSSRKTLIGRAVNFRYFGEIATAEQAYILGLLAADGNVSDSNRITFGLQVGDAELVQFVRDTLSPRSKLYTVRKRRRNFTSFAVTSAALATDLAQWGIVPRKSYSIMWPIGLGDLQRPFLLGYFDGDGCTYIVKDRYPGWNVCSGSEAFLIDMKEYILRSTGVTLQKIQRRRGTSLYQVSKTGAGAYTLNQWLHQDGLGLARKMTSERIAARYAS